MSFDIDRYSHINSILQRWDPRFKITALGTLIFAIALIQTIPLAATSLLVAILLLLASRLPLSFVMHGVKWVVLFLLPFFIIMPLSYPGNAAFSIASFSFAWEGVQLATLIVTKALAIVLLAYAIFGSTRFDIAMISLQHLKCPKIIVQMLLFTYRYLFVFLNEMKRMDTAMSARGFVKKFNYYTLKTIGNFIGTLLIRSFERTERIYKAMLSKGYTGEFFTLVEFHATRLDAAKAVLIAVIAIALLALDRSNIFKTAHAGWW